MPSESGVVVDLVRPSDVRLARAAVAELLRAALAVTPDDPLVIDTLLATSELVSNALEHTAGPCTLRAAVTGGGRTVRVDVTDRDADAHLTAAMPGVGQHHGRGLAIVEAVASRWGTERRPESKTVWFEVEIPPS